MIHKIYIHDEEDADCISFDVYAQAIYDCKSNQDLAAKVGYPEKYPAVLVFNWDESGDIHSLDYMFIYLSDFNNGRNE